MLTVSDMHSVRNLSASTDSAGVLWESNAVPATPPPREAFSIYSPAAIILRPNRLEEMQDFASFFTDGNASGILPFETGNKAAWARTSSNEADDTDPVVLGGSWPPLSLSSVQSTNPSFEGSPSAQDSANSLLMQQNFDNRGGGDNNGDGVGTSGSCSSNDGPSSFSSITRSMEILHNISDKQTASRNYSIWDHHPQGFHGWQPQGFHGRQPQGFHGWQPQSFHVWVDQGGRQRSRMVNYGSKHYERHDRYDWSSYGPMCIRDPQLQLGHLRPTAMLPHMPATMPIFVPPPLLQCNYGPMRSPGFPPQMLPTHPQPDLSSGHPFVFLPAPLPAPASMPFSLEGHKRALIMKQIEFYFSSENLRTDFYLKLHMDNNGWVSIHLIAGFRRIKRLTDNISFILDALIPSVVVEVERNRVRKRFGWNDWVRKSPRSQNSTDSGNKS